ncbi:sulfite exporter TauE/SafE family protein [Jinshanibacter sp. LJY008]|uniref:Probable membrane transporter protein n=1 Tax=Limnobaculum eriocheiris TaxID=2897391 RepID=A0A9X1MVL7_9GAMM|nr:sulfite exporter TauE/SafE family protein [Limnobaculum eriocheiris]MCD1125769.1 sulfite exporter TauE/SafE family protein [Limnobaculum eriocheiris]
MTMLLALLAKAFIGALLGLIISTTGVGGGVLILPVLIWLFGMDMLTAVATANLMSMLMKISSTGVHFRLGNIPLKRSLIILSIMLPSTLIASYGITLLASVDAWHQYVQFSINVLIVLAIVLSLLIFCTQLFHPTVLISDESVKTEIPITRFILPGVAAGITIGATGVGGGVVMLPVLTKYAGMNIKQAIGTSVFVTMLLSGASALAYGQGGYTDLHLALILSLGSILSIPFAKYLLKNISERAFQLITFAFILCSAVTMLYRLLASH